MEGDRSLWADIADQLSLRGSSFGADDLNADLLGRLGLTGNLYYLVLLPMGLAAAVFLFGVLRSYARYSGKQLGGMLELSGPIVAFVLVVILGFVLVKP